MSGRVNIRMSPARRPSARGMPSYWAWTAMLRSSGSTSWRPNRAAGFVHKWGATFHAFGSATEQYAEFAAAVETPTPQTYQVLRQTFDDVLLRHSAKSGATVLESPTRRPSRASAVAALAPPGPPPTTATS